MRVEEGNVRAEGLVRKVKEYLQIRFDLIRLELIDSTAHLLSTLIMFLFLILVLCFFLFFLSYATANYISTAVGIRYAGYFVVAGFYLTVAIVLFFIQKKSIHGPLMNKFIKIFLKDFKM